MTSSPIPRVLGTFLRHRVRALLMGGQACILYGGGEFSRDSDFAIAVDASNHDRLRAALAEIDAHPIFFPELSAEVLKRRHAAHFRCQAPGLHDLRIDLMHVMRGAADFAQL